MGRGEGERGDQARLEWQFLETVNMLLQQIYFFLAALIINVFSLVFNHEGLE